jgi:hypothetical protein
MPGDDQLNQKIEEFLESERRENATERILNRLESKAPTFGVREGAIDDVREHARKSKLESLDHDSTTAYFSKLRSERPHWFEAQAKTDDDAEKSVTARVESKPEKIDHKKSSKSDFSAFLRGLGVRG